MQRIDLLDPLVTPEELRDAFIYADVDEVLTPASWQMVHEAWEMLSQTELLWEQSGSARDVQQLLALAFVAMCRSCRRNPPQLLTSTEPQHSPTSHIPL